MTPELKEATRALGLNNRTFAALIGTGEDTVCGWGKRYRDRRGVQKEPIWAWHLIKAWTAHPDLLRAAIADSHAAIIDKNTFGPQNSQHERA